MAADELDLTQRAMISIPLSVDHIFYFIYVAYVPFYIRSAVVLATKEQLIERRMVEVSPFQLSIFSWRM